MNMLQPTQSTRSETVLALCKLLLDEDRLKILGLLAQQPHSAETLAAQSGVTRTKLHLHKLQEIGLVQPQQTATGEVYAFNRPQFFQLKKLLFAHEEAPEGQSAEEKELAKFVNQGQLMQLPVHPAKLRLVLAWLVEKFEPGVAYPERAVNERLMGHAVDYATLRRLLIDHTFLVRNAGIYKRVERTV